jgi:hypothetical protein
MEKILITPGIFQMLCNNYNPKSKEPVGGLLFAGKGRDNLWYCDTGHGGEFLFDFLIDGKHRYKMDYAKKNENLFRLVPWFQYDKKEFDENFYEFIGNEIKDNFQSFLILKPTRIETKRNFVFEYYYESIDDKILPGKIELAKSGIDKKADENIKKFMDYCILVEKRKILPEIQRAKKM